MPGPSSFCPGATPEDLQALYDVLVKVIHGNDAVAASITVDRTSIDHRLKHGPAEHLPSTVTAA